MFILLIAMRDKKIGSTMATHFKVFSILSIRLVIFQPDKHCSVEPPVSGLFKD